MEVGCVLALSRRVFLMVGPVQSEFAYSFLHTKLYSAVCFGRRDGGQDAGADVFRIPKMSYEKKICSVAYVAICYGLFMLQREDWCFRLAVNTL